MNQHALNCITKALTDGSHSQTVGYFKDENGYCINGLIFNVYMMDTGKGAWNSSIDFSNKYVPFTENWDKRPYDNPDFLKWVGLTSKNFEVFQTLNDEKKWTFEKFSEYFQTAYNSNKSTTDINYTDSATVPQMVKSRTKKKIVMLSIFMAVLVMISVAIF